MPQIDTEGRPVAQTHQVDSVIHAASHLQFTLVAEKEATVTFGHLSKTSRDGAPVRVSEEVGGLGNHLIELTTQGGHVELTVQESEQTVVEFSIDDQEPKAYRWTFVAQPNWTGGHINEEATEIAKMVERGEAPPSRAPSGDIPEKAEPALSSEFTRPWAPDKESEPWAPRKGNNPVDDDRNAPKSSTKLGDYEEKAGANKEPAKAADAQDE